MQKSQNVLWTWRQNLLFYFLAKKQNKTRWLTCTGASLHVRTTVETLETICIVINKDMYQSARLSFYYEQAPPPTPTKNHNNIGFPSKTGPDPLNKITKLPSQPSMLGHHRHASKNAIYMADRWRADEGPLIVVFGSSLVSTLVNLKEKSKLPLRGSIIYLCRYLAVCQHLVIQDG